jgi:hypothetical protein
MGKARGVKAIPRHQTCDICAFVAGRAKLQVYLCHVVYLRMADFDSAIPWFESRRPSQAVPKLENFISSAKNARGIGAFCMKDSL